MKSKAELKEILNAIYEMDDSELSSLKDAYALKRTVEDGELCDDGESGLLSEFIQALNTADHYEEIAKAYLKKNGYDYYKEADESRWMPMKMATTAIPEAKLPQPEEGESHFDMLKRWTKGEMTEYEEIELLNNLTKEQVIKEA